jgi:hypothetical protein
MIQSTKINKLHEFWESKSFMFFEKNDQTFLKELTSLSHANLKQATEALLRQRGDEFMRVRRQLRSLLEAWDSVLELKKHWNSTSESVEEFVPIHPALVTVMYIGLKGRYFGDPSETRSNDSFAVGQERKANFSTLSNRFLNVFQTGPYALRYYEQLRKANLGLRSPTSRAAPFSFARTDSVSWSTTGKNRAKDKNPFTNKNPELKRLINGSSDVEGESIDIEDDSSDSDGGD